MIESTPFGEIFFPNGRHFAWQERPSSYKNKNLCKIVWNNNKQKIICQNVRSNTNACGVCAPAHAAHQMSSKMACRLIYSLSGRGRRFLYPSVIALRQNWPSLNKYWVCVVHFIWMVSEWVVLILMSQPEALCLVVEYTNCGCVLNYHVEISSDNFFYWDL